MTPEAPYNLNDFGPETFILQGNQNLNEKQNFIFVFIGFYKIKELETQSS